MLAKDCFHRSCKSHYFWSDVFLRRLVGHLATSSGHHSGIVPPSGITLSSIKHFQVQYAAIFALCGQSKQFSMIAILGVPSRMLRLRSVMGHLAYRGANNYTCDCPYNPEPEPRITNPITLGHVFSPMSFSRTSFYSSDN